MAMTRAEQKRAGVLGIGRLLDPADQHVLAGVLGGVEDPDCGAAGPVAEHQGRVQKLLLAGTAMQLQRPNDRRLDLWSILADLAVQLRSCFVRLFVPGDQRRGLGVGLALQRADRSGDPAGQRRHRRDRRVAKHVVRSVEIF
jgi:hypothetical protein